MGKTEKKNKSYKINRNPGLGMMDPVGSIYKRKT
jgi:hypothetical protein